jgi:hypothetical protein
LLELRFQAGLVALLELGASGDGVPHIDQGANNRFVGLGESRHSRGQRGRLEIGGKRVVNPNAENRNAETRIGSGRLSFRT